VRRKVWWGLFATPNRCSGTAADPGKLHSDNQTFFYIPAEGISDVLLPLINAYFVSPVSHKVFEDKFLTDFQIVYEVLNYLSQVIIVR
jgi:hypothetical protein